MILWPRWAFMWSAAVAIYACCKLLTWSRAATREIPLERHLAYLFAWPGLDAERFLRGHVSQTVRPHEWFAAAVRIAAGSLIFAVIGRTQWSDTATGWVGVIGLGLMLHFGVFQLLSCFWRARHVAATPL